MLLIAFQVLLFISGNLSFLNIVSLAPAIAALDDQFLANILPSNIVTLANNTAAATTPSINYASWLFFIVVAILSIKVVRNLFSRYQAMNTSFDQFYLVNTYGAFGAVGKKRYELVVQGTEDKEITADTKWKEYEFLAKPTSLKRKLPIIAPYQPRIDWQIWFAAMERPEQNEWLHHLIWKFLHNDKGALSLISYNPFPHKPPKWIRVDHYIYQFEKPGKKNVWKRNFLGPYIPVHSKESLQPFIAQQGWKT